MRKKGNDEYQKIIIVYDISKIKYIYTVSHYRDGVQNFNKNIKL